MISCCANFFWLRQSIQGQSIAWTPQFLIFASAWFRKPLTPLKKFSQSSWDVCTSKPEQQTPSTFHTPNEHNSSHQKTDNTRGLGQLKNFNKKGQLFSTLTRTFYEANAAEVEDRRRRAAAATKWRTTRSTSVGPFCRRAHATGRPAAAPTFYGEKLSSILRAHAASGGEWDRPRGDIWAHRSSKWPSKERERAVFLSEWEWPSTERASGVGRRRQRRAITTCVSDVRKEETLYGNQMRWVLRHEHIQVASKGDAS
jgi:hypothetical protein